MTTIIAHTTVLSPRGACAAQRAAPRSPRSPRRRFALTARTPRELVVPLLTPMLFALVIAPALKRRCTRAARYEAYVATGTIGLLIPLNTMFGGLGVIVDRESGAQRELLAAPIPRALLVLGNLAVAFAITALQVGVLIGRLSPRGIRLRRDGAGIAWFVGRSGALRRRHVRRRRDAREPACRARRSTSARDACDRDRAVVPRRLALPDQRDAVGLTWIAKLPAAHARARADALRPAAAMRAACTRSGGWATTTVAAGQPRRGRGLRAPADPRRDPIVHTLGDTMTV